jgi:hypothetical protein
VEKVDVVVKEGRPQVSATLPPAGQEIAERGASTFWKSIQDNPGTSGLVGGGVAVALMAWRILARRKALAGRGGQ